MNRRSKLCAVLTILAITLVLLVAPVAKLPTAHVVSPQECESVGGCGWLGVAGVGLLGGLLFFSGVGPIGAIAAGMLYAA